MPIDYESARGLLQTAFETAESALLAGDDVKAPSEHISEAVDSLFTSRTQAFREALLRFECGWDIQWQGINVADSASGVGGDIIITSDDSILLAAKVTERAVDRNRVVATFNSKIGPHGIEDYLFFVNSESQPVETSQQVRQYFAQGHEVNFVVIADWVAAVMATLGHRGRTRFIERILQLLDLPDTPVAVKHGWNQSVDQVISG